MPPQYLVPPNEIDVTRIEVPMEEVRKFNQQRFEMEQLSGILRYDPEQGICIGLRHVKPDEFWVRGHVPGRPLLPGVLMCECAAQVASYYTIRYLQHKGFIGFGGMEEVKFRGQVVPGDTLVMVGKSVEIRSRRAVFECQGLVGDRIVFQCRIIGMPM
jgi:3-hydroxyacyl-[acyl-carrier-protein] dehydratase